MAFDIGVTELHQIRRDEEPQRRGARHSDLYGGLAREIERSPVPQLQAQWNRHGLFQLRDQTLDAAFDEHVIFRYPANIIASRALSPSSRRFDDPYSLFGLRGPDIATRLGPVPVAA